MKLLNLLMLLIMFNSCSFWNDDIKRDDDKLTIPKTTFTGNQFHPWQFSQPDTL